MRALGAHCVRERRGMAGPADAAGGSVRIGWGRLGRGAVSAGPTQQPIRHKCGRLFRDAPGIALRFFAVAALNMLWQTIESPESCRDSCLPCAPNSPNSSGDPGKLRSCPKVAQ